MSNKTRCPYTRQSLDQLLDCSKEHVIFDAIGGPDDYSVTVNRDSNSWFGGEIDGPFVDSELVIGLRHGQRIRSRSGIPSLVFNGKTADGEWQVRVLLPADGPTKVDYWPPFKFSGDGTRVQVRASIDQVDRALAEVRKSLARKGGRLLDTIKRQTLPPPEIHCVSTEDLNVLRAGLLKTAYLSTFEYVGDPFLDDPLNAEWQRAIRTTIATSPEERLKIRGLSCRKNVSLFFPNSSRTSMRRRFLV